MKRTNIQTSLISLTVASILVFAGCQPHTQPTVEPASQPAGRTAKVVFPLAQAIKQPISDYTLDELAEIWPAFRHAPIETAGFNHFTLPFHYTSIDGSGDSNEALAFSFLLSHSLDWAPGSYCSYHAYFTFKRARRYVQKLARKYDKGLIKFALEDWGATHAVGGKIVHSKDGYAGTLLIYDRNAKKVFRKDYKKSREYFDLLGDMCVDAMKFLGHEPSRALVQHLHRRRCRHHQSIIDLGKAAFAEEKSDEAFAIHKRILKRDPGFADVRHWWANQKWWRDSDWNQYMYHTALALDSYLTEEALRGFSPEDCPDKKLASQYGEWMRDAEWLVGPGHPTILENKLESAYAAEKVSHDLMVCAMKAAAKCPNSHWFLWELGRANRHWWGSGDADMAASIHLVGMRDRYLVNIGGKNRVSEAFALSVMELGHYDIAAQVLRPMTRKKYRSGGASKAAWSAGQLAQSLDQMGGYEEAAGYYRIAFHGLGKGDPTRIQYLVEGGIAAALAGKSDMLEQILRDHHKELADAKILFLMEAYRDAMVGKPIDIKAVKKKAKRRTPWSHRQEDLLYAQVDLLAEKSKQRASLTGWLQVSPDDRAFWILFDAYDRKYPRPESACFYEAVEWLHGNDPWVKKAVADYRQRAKKTSVPSANELLKRLKDFTPIPWPKPDSSRKKAARKILFQLPPGAVAAAIRRLVTKGEFNKAEELALRFYHLVIDSEKGHKLRSHASHLFHMARQARQKADRLKAKTNLSGL